ncbi:hypothetical protein WR25_16701 [Diploscapter pachys]|uniref:Uncharacterized protein n=1 Tax=Diploscapter pachys TaxID=2018661 RepID=A0A2A2LUJ5_9BILA|nr:hypothetical protein WR25_16701 [Diploscapter pachys]
MSYDSPDCVCCASSVRGAVCRIPWAHSLPLSCRIRSVPAQLQCPSCILETRGLCPGSGSIEYPHCLNSWVVPADVSPQPKVAVESSIDIPPNAFATAPNSPPISRISRLPPPLSLRPVPLPRVDDLPIGLSF